MNPTAHDPLTLQSAHRRTRPTARLDQRCRRADERLTAAIKKSQELLAAAHSDLPVEEAPWRLPAALTMHDDESDLGRGIQFFSDSIVTVETLRIKLVSLAECHRESFTTDSQGFGRDPEEGQALERVFDLAVAAAGCALEALSSSQAMAHGCDAIADNWFSIALLAGEIRQYERAVPTAYDLAQIGHRGPVYRQIKICD